MNLKLSRVLILLTPFLLFSDEDSSDTAQIEVEAVDTDYPAIEVVAEPVFDSTIDLAAEPIDDSAIEFAVEPIDDSSLEHEPIAAFSAQSDPCEEKPVCGYDHRIQIGGNYTYAWITPQDNPTTTGSLGGVIGIYEYRPLESVYAGAAFSYRIGTTTDDVGSRELQDFNPQGRVGYTFADVYNTVDRFTLFSGFGVRYMGEIVTLGTATLDLNYTTLYIPVGFLLEHSINDDVSIGCNFQWMPQVLPMVRLIPLNGAEWDLTLQLLNFCVEIPITMTLCEDRYTLSINPFFETWRDGESTAETLTGLTLGLPGNTYFFTGVNVNFGFNF